MTDSRFSDEYLAEQFIEQFENADLKTRTHWGFEDSADGFCQLDIINPFALNAPLYRAFVPFQECELLDTEMSFFVTFFDSNDNDSVPCAEFEFHYTIAQKSAAAVAADLYSEVEQITLDYINKRAAQQN